MNPEEKELVRRTFELSEQNNRILRDLRKALKWSRIWGVTKIVIFILPFIFGYVYLKPYFGPFSESFQGASELLKGFR